MIYFPIEPKGRLGIHGYDSGSLNEIVFKSPDKMQQLLKKTNASLEALIDF